MKRAKIVTLAVSLFVMTGVNAGVNDGLVAHYPFDGNAQDATENNPDGNVVGATLVVDRDGSPNSAYYFVPGNRIEVSDIPGVSTNEGTVSLWVNFQTIGSRDGVFRLGYIDGGTGLGFFKYQGGPFNNLFFQFRNTAVAVTEVESALPQTGVWHLWTLTWTKNPVTNVIGMKMYMDGVLIDDDPRYNPGFPSDFNHTPPFLVLGRYDFANNHWASYLTLDDFRLYNRALSDQEVQQLANPSPTIACEGFEPPLDISPVSVRGNRALPFKAELVDEDGMYLTDSDIAAPPVIQIMFESNPPEEYPLEAYDLLSIGHGTDGNVFVFTEDEKWQINVKVTKNTSPGTYTAYMVSGDEDEYVIDPTCQVEFVVK